MLRIGQIRRICLPRPRFFSCTSAGIVVLLVSVSRPGAAQERSPLVESIDLHVPVAPASVRIGGSLHLVYELHMTNARPDTVRLERIRILSSDDTTRTLAEFRGEALARHVQPLPRGASSDPATTFAPGVRRVFYAWLPLPAAAAAPNALRHIVDLSTRRAQASSELVVRSAPLQISRASPVTLHPPLRGGPWVALYDPLLAGGHRMATYALDGRARIPARYAMDWVKLPTSGVFDAQSRAPDHNGYGADVLAVAEGTIVGAVDDMPDNDDTTAPARRGVEYASGNYVVLALGVNRFAFYEHLKPGSIRVRNGQRVRPGDVLAQLGNSGSSSIGPHLHFHVSDANALLAAEGMPFVFRSFQQLGAFGSIHQFVDGVRWGEAPNSNGQTRTLEMPAPNAVLLFP